jgi:hypothetical protein
MGYPQQALYCWAKGYHIDPNNVAALWDRAMLAKELGDLRTVLRLAADAYPVAHLSSLFFFGRLGSRSSVF